MEREKTRAKLIAWTLFPTGLLLFILATLFGVNIPGDELLLSDLMKAVALLGLILVAVATAVAYAYLRRVKN